MTKRWPICFIYLVVALFILNVFIPVVQAQDISKSGKSGKTVLVSETIAIQADDSVNWSKKINVANGTDYRFLDYNLTWVPFLQNNTDIRGIIVHSVLPPIEFNMSVSNQSISTGSIFRLTPDMIIDGVSEAWFRIPVANIPANATILARVARISDITRFNLSFYNLALPLFSYTKDVQLVGQRLSNPSISNVSASGPMPLAWHDARRWLNISVPDSNNTFWYNFTYLKLSFPMFPNEWYYLEYDILAPYAQDMKLLYSTSDFGNDGRYNSWLWLNGTTYFYPADLDTPFICTYGMSNGITGIGVNERQRAGTSDNSFLFNASIPIGQTIDNTSNRWFNLLVPFLKNITVPTLINLILIVTFYSTYDDSNPFYYDICTLAAYQAWSDAGTYGFFLESIDLNDYNATYIDHIRFEVVIINGTGPPEASAIKFWGMQLTENWTHEVGFTNLFWAGHIGGNWHFISDQVYFVPYGYYALDSWRFNMTNQSILVIPQRTPTTALGIAEMMQKFEAWLVQQNHTSKSVFDKLTDLLKWLAMKAAEIALSVANWVLNLPPIHWLLDRLADIFKFFKGIAVWLYGAFSWLVDALEWFTYWAVRAIYSFSIAIVYIVNIFGVISINSALLAVVRTGNGKDFVKAFRAGWNFVFAVISLLLSLAIMAISIVAAVVPF